MRDDRLREGPVITCIVLTVVTQNRMKRFSVFRRYCTLRE